MSAFRLAFGTAGLRAPMRPGPEGMNLPVVVQATAGLANWLKAQGRSGQAVVVGCDARHHSAEFAHAAAEVLAGAGFTVIALPHGLPTPVTAFAVRRWSAAAGVQITASHNPAQDNGYKVYLGSADSSANGAQLVPPADAQIEQAILAVGEVDQVPRAAVSDDPRATEALAAYLERVGQIGYGSRENRRSMRIALTPMHGVGGAVAVEALRRAGFEDVHVVAEQFEPDPDFPTVAFPNPEEPGASDLLLALAERVDADVAVALDPDADRCALGFNGAGGWRMLTGDETGTLLGGWVLDNTAGPDRLTASTIVSSGQLQALAQSRGLRHVRTLTGFKWLVRAGEGLVYAYEEAIGHCVDPTSVRDKDGISAAVLAADLVAELKAQGRTAAQVFDDYALELGVFATRQVSLRFAQLSGITEAMAQLRASPPAELAGQPVAFEDLAEETDAVVLTGPGFRVVIRPSGTEPKLKAYLEAVALVADREGLAQARAQAQERLERLAEWASTLV